MQKIKIKNTYPLHPRVLEDLSGTEAQSGISYQQLADKILGGICDVSPVLVRKLVFALLDALEQVTLQAYGILHGVLTRHASRILERRRHFQHASFMFRLRWRSIFFNVTSL